MTALTVGVDRVDLGGHAEPGDPARVRSAGPAEDWSGADSRADQTVRSWPLLVLAAPAAAEVSSGWVGIAQKTGFGLVRPLPGIWPSLHLDTAITLPIGVEAYAAYALRAWLARDPAISARTRRFAKWSATCSFALGMAGQVAYHLMVQFGPDAPTGPVGEILRDEERWFVGLLACGLEVLARFGSGRPLTPADLACLHQTHGLPPELVTELPPSRTPAR